MGGWVGPTIVAAVIAGLVNVLGWIVTSRETLANERRRRNEKVRDFQIALRAEIRSELANLKAYDLDRYNAEIKRRYDVDPTYSVVIPHPARHVIFEAISGEIQILPENVIDPVVL